MWKKIKHAYHQLGSPQYFYGFAGALAPWLLAIAAILTVWGMYGGLVTAPMDYQQGDSYRIIFIHVPAAWMSMFVYMVMAATGLVALVWRIKMAEIMAIASAPVGAAFTLLALVTGSLWGKPMWGTWWEWDARLTSELFLLFLYLGIMGLYAAIEDRRKAARAAALLALVGVVNIPIIHFSVNWWNTLHQGSTVKIVGESAIHGSMLVPLIVMTFATKFYYGAATLIRAQNLILEHERKKSWVNRLL